MKTIEEPRRYSDLPPRKGDVLRYVDEDQPVMALDAERRFIVRRGELALVLKVTPQRFARLLLASGQVRDSGILMSPYWRQYGWWEIVE